MDTTSLFGGNRYFSATGPGDDLTIFILGGDHSIAESNEVGPGKDVDAFRVWGTGSIVRGITTGKVGVLIGTGRSSNNQHQADNFAASVQ